MMLACLTLPGLVSPAVAQRAGAAHGGFSGQSASAPRSSAPGGGGFSRGPIGVHPSPGPRAFSPGGPIGMRPAAPRGFNYSNSSIRFGSPYSPGARIPYNRVGASGPVSGRVHGPVLGPENGHGHNGGHDGGYGSGDGDHHHHRGVYRGGYVYPYYPWFYAGPIFTGYVDPWLFGPNDYYGYGYGDDVPAPYRDYGMQNSQPYPPEYYQGNPALPAQDPASQQGYEPQEQTAGSPSAGSGERAVTLIFNDGRPPVQIHNYLLTASTLTVLDQQYREIPLNRINVSATEQANHAAGVDFRVPVKQ
jgi:hypothetical protein